MVTIVLVVSVVTLLISLWKLAQGLGNIMRHESDE